ncbi:gametogenetin-binding protein 2 isoform X3 [Rhinichthys klamathensis goyatoka]|uniref:gametogenetin-binding protein 2 isoform X3 n=1 Tax=Rhinichthys klamathensis goyatoka TaxID=3034132 RepID=UPI0024B5314D|nr:gametogenetin-binding protein 2 isoform X3 [Rhinichthys klamathensis goyatoka]
MARLVAVCRDGEEEYLFLARQIPLYIDDTLTMVMEFPDSVLEFDSYQINSSQMKQFIEHHSLLKQQDLNMALMVMSREVISALAQSVPCVGCRRSVEHLFSQLTDSGYFALEPLTVGSSGVLSVTRACLTDPRQLYTLFYVHGSKLNNIIDSIPKSKKNKRCQLHSLDTHKPKPLGGSWMDVWELMSQDCRDEVVLIDSSSLLETLETYLRKHRFCTDCKNKVLRAYNILVGDLDCSKEKGYCASLYEGLRCCPHERHIHVCCETDFIAHLLGRAEPEFAGGYERRERHAKTIDIAQEEVLTCLGIHLYERLHRIWQKLRAEEQTWQMLFYLGIDALRKSFEMAVERVQGISRLEQLCEELSEEERAKELKQEKKRQKRKNRRKNKCEQEAEGEKDKSLDEGSSESVDGGCKSCGSGEESGSVEVIITSESSSCTCPATSILRSPKTQKGECSCSHHCSEEKEDAVDSCVECWAISEDNTNGKNKKKKRKNKGSICGSLHIASEAEEMCVSDGSRRGSAAVHESSSPSPHLCRSKEELCCESFESIRHHVRSSECLHSQPLLPDACTEANKSLVELLNESEVTSDEENCLTQDEIQSFVENNKSFYRTRDQYRQHLKDRFTKYCRGEWLPTAHAH